MTRDIDASRRATLKLAATFAAATLLFGAARADEPIRIGLVIPMTGPFASTGRQVDAAVKLFMAQSGGTVAGRKVEVILKDDAGVADTTRREAQELVVNDKVTVLAGFGLTPLAFATAPIATQSKTPMVVMCAATSVITERSPYIVRSGFTVPQITLGIADWSTKNKIRKVVTLVSDYGPGIDAERTFTERFTAGGGTVTSALRVPMANPDFAPFLQRVRDAQPDAVFVFVPSGLGGSFMKQFSERGLGKAGIRLLATGDVVDDDLLNDMGDAALGVVSSHHYSAAHASAVNKKFVEDFEKANNGMRPNFHAVGAYDGMRVILEALKATKGAGGDALLAAMKGQSFESPRGPVTIDPQTREVVQNVYTRRVERVPAMGNQLFNVEIDTMAAVKDPGKAK
ncbi:ABC transporter substrate-binding protein [Scleromatobacter humisilvae]|uniref:ABC transporter substrate-binding protein n=1 Tax=Scleromatobacter humisilvae TaxID=2897159 RepID=A0A9X2BZH3_9BURK|nr:ABC transporter substrate-binding protein [Scleromatobacter humisilvae]MCK9685381.1 ABC transporter substrate-binding protein [Scleromatobacter humisilvae]